MKQSEQIPNSFECMLKQGAPLAGGWLDLCTPPNAVQRGQLAGARSELGAELETHPVNSSEMLSGHTGNSHQFKQELRL